MPLAKPLMEAAGNAALPTYIEDVFSTYLYAGTGATQTITNNIDLSTKGGLVWTKSRTITFGHNLQDTARGAGNRLNSASANSSVSDPTSITSFNTNGFSLGADSVSATCNSSGYNYASWTFRKQPKFFDVVTYTGDGAGTRFVNHSLNAEIGCLIIKRTDSTSNWVVWHRGNGSSGSYTGMEINSTAASSYPLSNYPHSTTQFKVSNNVADSAGVGVNVSGATYVAYLFAHNAGGFGLTGTDNVISCGSFTADASGNATVSLGYEPQWILWKSVGTGSWVTNDTMRGYTTLGGTGQVRLYPNLSSAEGGPYNQGGPTSTGFTINNESTNQTYIYIAIRRGPMKVPTDGTTVFVPALASSSGAYTVTTNFPVDSLWYGQRTGTTNKFYLDDRLRGQLYLQQNTTGAEAAENVYWDSMTKVYMSYTGDYSGYINWAMRRAPSFFDVVCYTGNVTARTINHNLAAVPELIIVKNRGSVSNWAVYSAATGNGNYLGLNTTTGQTASTTYWNSTDPTSSVFSLGTSTVVNASGNNYVAYLFATCAGVSKVGSYTGTGATQTIACGFTGGARFVMIKRTDSTGGWYVWDTTRGMVAGSDWVLSINSTSADSNANNVYTATGGFQLVSADAGINANGGTYIFLAIA